MTAFSIIVPTMGRHTLPRALESIRSQLGPRDELFVYRDASNDWGATPRNRGCREAARDFLLFMDDDDVYLPGAIEVMRALVSAVPDRVHIFRMTRPSLGDAIWTTPKLRQGNVSTQMFAVPNDKSKLGAWSRRYECDFDFLTSTLALRNEEPLWHDEIVAAWRPELIHTPAHRCPEPELCDLLGMHLAGRLHDIWHGRNIDAHTAAAYRRRWLAAAGKSMLDVPERLQPRLILSPSETLLQELAATNVPCVHLGAKTSRIVLCPSCRGRVSFFVHRCALHGRCVQRKAPPGIASCESCGDRKTAWSSAYTRHLLYHICPIAGNDAWRRNVAMLLDRIDQFQGRRLVGVVTGDGLDDPDMVKEAFAGAAELSVFPNDPGLGEVVSFRALLPEIARYTGRRDVTFYAHAKGVRRPWDAGSAVPDWVRLLYEINLDYPAVVDAFLDRFPIVGAFKKSGHNPWHYVGSFWWVRNRDLFGRRWARILHAWGGTEFYPGHQFMQHEAGCLFGQGGPNLILYHKPVMDLLLREYEAWKMSMSQYRR